MKTPEWTTTVQGAFSSLPIPISPSRALPAAVTALVAKKLTMVVGGNAFYQSENGTLRTKMLKSGYVYKYSQSLFSLVYTGRFDLDCEVDPKKALWNAW
jgi:hypothetical protein